MGKKSYQKSLLGIKRMHLAGVSHGFSFLGNFVGRMWQECKNPRQFGTKAVVSASKLFNINTI